MTSASKHEQSVPDKKSMKGSLEDFEQWCRDRGHYATLASLDRYQMYMRSKVTTERVMRQQATSCED